MGDECIQPRGGVLNRWPMPGKKAPGPQGPQATRRRKKTAHISIRRRDQGRRPRHHNIAGEYQITQLIRQMPRKVAGCAQRFDVSATGCNNICVLHQDVRTMRAIDTLTAAQPAQP